MNIPNGQDFTVEVETDSVGDPATSVQLSVNSGLPVSQRVTNRIARFPFPGGLTAPGIYNLSAVAVNAAGSSAPITDSLEIIVRTPNAPIRLTIIVGQ